MFYCWCGRLVLGVVWLRCVVVGGLCCLLVLWLGLLCFGFDVLVAFCLIVLDTSIEL